MTRINTNVSSIVAQNVLGRSNSELQTALTRLSTGLRINNGADDPAGLIASEALRSDIVSTEKAIGNSERANQVIATADSSLGQVSSLLNDIRGLIVEAANTGAMSDEEIAANQLQVDSSLEALNRVAQTTTFQGRKLLDGSLDFIVEQGAGFTSVDDLRIDQANLGAAGSMDVDVSIAAAATKAEITNAIPETSTAQFTLDNQTFTVNSKASADLSSITVATAINAGPEATGTATIGGHDFALTAATGISAVSTDVNTTTDTLEATGTVTIDQTELTITVADNVTIDDVNVKTAVADLGLAQIAAFNLTDATGGGDIEVDIEVNAGGDIEDDDNITVALAAPGTESANYTTADNTLTITLANDATDISAADLATLIENATIDGGAATGQLFNATGLAGGTVIQGNDTVAITGGSTMAQEHVQAAYSSTTNTLTVTVNSAIVPGESVTATEVKTAVELLANFGAVAHTAGPSNIDVDEVSAETVGTLERAGVEATYDATPGSEALTLTFDSEQAVIDIADVISAIDGLAEFVDTTSTSSTGSINGGSVATESVGTLTEINGAVASFNETSNVLTLTFDGSNNAVTAGQVEDAIDALTTYFENTSSTGTGGIDATALSATGSLATGGQVQDLVMRVSGEYGSEALTFKAGTSFDLIADAIQAVSDSTGVLASASSSTLTLTSANYGSDAVVAIEVISEGPGGTFASNLSDTRATGSDVVASVNGVEASGDGNVLSIQTVSLDLTMKVDDGSDTNVSFTIDGGGALFQLGPDVVSNQQARLGIQSVSIASLGGPSGRLYQLGSGGDAALDTDTTTAMRIVDEVIGKVTSLRGRLGAFQRTTLDTNIAALGDTLVNITEAESMIRDADFAVETAALTRAQILVQSGTSVLAIANSSPQNVLALLR